MDTGAFFFLVKMDTGAWCFSNQHHFHQFTSVLNFWTPGVGLVGEYLGHLILEQKPRLKSEYCITVTQLVADNCDKKTTKRKTKLFFPHDITVQFSCIFFIYNSIYDGNGYTCINWNLIWHWLCFFYCFTLVCLMS